MKIATFNINNIQRRLPILLKWLKASKPDVVCLQELKAAHEAFPTAAIERAGYFAVHRGERTWNGVAILARKAKPIVTRMELPGDPSDRQSRYIEAAVGGILIALHLSAQRQSAARPEIRLQAGLVRSADQARRGAASAPGSR